MEYHGGQRKLNRQLVDMIIVAHTRTLEVRSRDVGLIPKLIERCNQSSWSKIHFAFVLISLIAESTKISPRPPPNFLLPQVLRCSLKQEANSIVD